MTMTDPDIPTEALEVAREAVARHRNPELRGIGPQRDIVVMPDEYAECVALADTALAAAAPHLIAEGRRQAAAEIRAAVKASPLAALRGGDVGWGVRQAYDVAARIAEGTDHG